MNINNKVKQFFSGGWGDKLPFKIPKDFGTEEPKIYNKKKKKKKKTWAWKTCPFCNEEIPYTKEKNNIFIFNYLYDKKCKCGAKEVDNCPCCKRKTWFKDGIYKHPKEIFNCGFIGERKNG